MVYLVYFKITCIPCIGASSPPLACSRLNPHRIQTCTVEAPSNDTEALEVLAQGAIDSRSTSASGMPSFMAAKEGNMAIGRVFNNKRTQTVRLPAELRFPDSVKKIVIRVVGQERIIAPAESVWDSFFLAETSATEDFMAERTSQFKPGRKSL